MQEFFVENIHFYDWQTMNRPAKNYYYFSWCKLLGNFPSVQKRGNTNKEGEIPCAKNIYEALATDQVQ